MPFGLTDFTVGRGRMEKIRNTLFKILELPRLFKVILLHVSRKYKLLYDYSFFCLSIIFNIPKILYMYFIEYYSRTKSCFHMFFYASFFIVLVNGRLADSANYLYSVSLMNVARIKLIKKKKIDLFIFR